MGEPFPATLASVARAIATDLQPLFPGLPHIFFGHSFGALVAFETIRIIERDGGDVPLHFFASGRVAPSLHCGSGMRADLADNELVEGLLSIGFEHQNLLSHPGFRHTLLGTLRADLSLNDTYRCEGTVRIKSPVTVFGGNHDILAPTRLIAGWSEHTSGSFSHHVFEGGHFFLRPRVVDVTASMRAIIANSLQSMLSPS